MDTLQAEMHTRTQMLPRDGNKKPSTDIQQTVPVCCAVSAGQINDLRSLGSGEESSSSIYKHDINYPNNTFICLFKGHRLFPGPRSKPRIRGIHTLIPGGNHSAFPLVLKKASSAEIGTIASNCWLLADNCYRTFAKSEGVY